MINEPHSIRTICVLVKKELASYFNSPIAYIVLCVFLVSINWLFFKPFFLLGEASLRNFFTILPWLFLLLIPALTMRLWAEEKKSGTIELLLTMPISNWQLVLAKFISSFLFLCLCLILTFNLPFTVSRLGVLDMGPVIGGYIGAAMLGGTFLSFGLFVSSLTKNQIIAFICALAGIFLIYVSGSSFVLSGLPDAVAKVLLQLGAAERFAAATKGVLDTKDFVYYISLISFFLWLNTKVLETAKWK